MTSDKKIPLVSVILPMYNAGRYIKSCVESVLCQTMPDFELICIDDCSTDDTLKIVKDFAGRDARIKIARTKKNSGAAYEPRNIGLKTSRGKYIAFIDSDDLYTKTALEELLKVAEDFQADVVDTEKIYRPEDEQINFDDVTGLPIYTRQTAEFCTAPKVETDNLAERLQNYLAGKYFCIAPNKIYRRDFLMNNDIKFPPVKLSEDIVFYFFVLCTAPKIVRAPGIVYIYRQNPESVTHRNSRSDDAKKILDQALDIITAGVKSMDDFMKKIPALEKNSWVRMLAIDYFVQGHYPVIAQFYEKLPPEQTANLIADVLPNYAGENAAFFSYIFNAFNTYRKRLFDYENKIRELQRVGV